MITFQREGFLLIRRLSGNIPGDYDLTGCYLVFEFHFFNGFGRHKLLKITSCQAVNTLMPSHLRNKPATPLMPLFSNFTWDNKIGKWKICSQNTGESSFGSPTDMHRFNLDRFCGISIMFWRNVIIGRISAKSKEGNTQMPPYLQTSVRMGKEIF